MNEPTDKPATSDEDLLKEALERFQLGESADTEERDRALEDLRFAVVPGAQWDSVLRQEREAAGLPCLEINTLKVILDRVVNSYRQNPTSIKIRPKSKGSKKKAELRNGIIRNIETVSNCSTIVYPMSLWYSANIGRAWMRVNVRWTSSITMEQEPYVELVPDPLSVVVDPIINSQLPNYCDPNWLFVPKEYPLEEFKRLYPDAKISNFEQFRTSVYATYDSWYSESMVRVTEYYRKRLGEKYTLYLMPDGKVLDSRKIPGEPLNYKAQREVQGYIIEQSIISCAEVLEKPEILDWTEKIPFVPAWGDEANIEGERRTWGITRFAKDPHRTYNYDRTRYVEQLMYTDSPLMVEESQIKGLETIWNNMGRLKRHYIPFRLNEKAPGLLPYRLQPAAPPFAISEAIATSAQEKRDVTGVYEAMTGEKSNEKSGKAVIERRASGELNVYSYPHNISISLVWLAQILLYALPKVYSGEQQIRVRNLDGTEDYHWINKVLEPGENPADYGEYDEKDVDVVTDPETGEEVRVLNALDVGEYDCTSTIGPAYATQRQEVLDNLTMITQGNESAFMLLADAIISLMDFPNSEKYARRFKYMLPEPLRSEELAKEDTPPPEMPEPEPDPELEMEMALKEKEMALKDKEIEGREIENEGKLIDIQGKMREQELREREALMPKEKPEKKKEGKK